MSEENLDVKEQRTLLGRMCSSEGKSDISCRKWQGREADRPCSALLWQHNKSEQVRSVLILPLTSLWIFFFFFFFFWWCILNIWTSEAGEGSPHHYRSFEIVYFMKRTSSKAKQKKKGSHKSAGFTISIFCYLYKVQYTNIKVLFSSISSHKQHLTRMLTRFHFPLRIICETVTVMFYSKPGLIIHDILPD